MSRASCAGWDSVIACSFFSWLLSKSAMQRGTILDCSLRVECWPPYKLLPFKPYTILRLNSFHVQFRFGQCNHYCWYVFKIVFVHDLSHFTVHRLGLQNQPTANTITNKYTYRSRDMSKTIIQLTQPNP